MGELQGIWDQYIRERTPELRRTLIEAYAPLARYVVDRLNLRPGPALEYDDLLSQAVVGLIDAVDRFDPTRGIKFETYAYHRIRGAVMDMLRDLDWLPRSVRQREAEMAAAYEAVEKRLSRPPTDVELAEELGVTVDRLDEMAQEVGLQAMQSLDEAIGRSPAPGRGSGAASGTKSRNTEGGALGDLVADTTAPSPEEEVERWAEREMLARGIEALPEAERTVVSLYYHEGLTLKEIGRVMGVTESRACQIHGKAMVRLRAQIQAKLGRTAPTSRAKSPGPAERVRMAGSRSSTGSRASAIRQRRT